MFDTASPANPAKLVDVIDDLWTTAATVRFLTAPKREIQRSKKLLRILDGLKKRRKTGAEPIPRSTTSYLAGVEVPGQSTRWPQLETSLALYLPPPRAKSAIGPKWWERIDANLNIDVVAGAADPLTAYGERYTPAWASAVRELRPNILAGALHPLFENISNGVIRMEGVRDLLAAKERRQKIPVQALKQRRWSIDSSGTLIIHLPGSPIFFSNVRLVAPALAATESAPKRTPHKAAQQPTVTKDLRALFDQKEPPSRDEAFDKLRESYRLEGKPQPTARQLEQAMRDLKGDPVKPPRGRRVKSSKT